MSFFDNLVRTMKGLANDALDAAADPSRDARQLVRDMDEKIAEAERASVDVKAEFRMLQSKKEKADDELAKWDANARKAIAAGDDGLARECLNEKKKAGETAGTLAEQIARLEPTVREIDERIADLRRHRDEMSHRTGMIEARQHVADAQEKAATALSGIGGKDLTAEFDRLEEKVAKQEARADVLSGMADERNGNHSLEERLRALDKGGVDDELAALKKEMGK